MLKTVPMLQVLWRTGGQAGGEREGWRRNGAGEEAAVAGDEHQAVQVLLRDVGVRAGDELLLHRRLADDGDQLFAAAVAVVGGSRGVGGSRAGRPAARSLQHGGSATYNRSVEENPTNNNKIFF